MKKPAPRIYRTTALDLKTDRKLMSMAARRSISVAALLREFIDQGLERAGKS